MKKYFLFIALGASALSCKKVLDTDPLTAVSGDQVWSSTSTAEDFIYNTYASILNNGYAQSHVNTSTPNPDQISIVDAYTDNNLSFDAIYNANYTQPIFSGTLTNNNDADATFNDFAQIRQCNLIIDNVAASTGISASDKPGLIAQGKFLRAIQNFYIARAFGKIIWIDTVLDANAQLRLPTTANPAESYGYIIKDLQDAIAGLPATSTSGVANKYVAAAFLSEVCLEAVAYSNYPAAPSVGSQSSLIQMAIDNANLVINSGQYTLDANYGEMFNGVNPTSSEIIFGDYLSSLNTELVNTPMQDEVLNVNNGRLATYGGEPTFTTDLLFQAWGVDGPTQDLANDYLVIDKNNPSQALPWDQTSQFKAAVSVASRPSTTDIPHNAGETDVEYGIVNPASGQSMWTLTNTGRDARWAASIVSDSTVFQGQLLTMVPGGNATRYMKITGAAYYVSLTNLYWNKTVWAVAPNYFYTNPTNYAWVITRLGRVYLNLAEAYLLKGDVADAVTALNQTRTVHGKLPPSTAGDLGTAWTDYKRERRVELTKENDYYWSLLRWGLYGGEANHGNAPVGDIPELEKIPTVMDISRDRQKFVVTQGAYYGLNANRHFDYPRRYLLPISVTGYILQNPNIVQNPGW
jgi:hypothetical protein